MSLITWPTAVGIKHIEWALDQPAQVNRSEFTGRRQVSLLKFATRWSAKIQLNPIIGEATMLAWRSFLMQIQGPANTFQIRAVENVQRSGANPLVGAAAAGAVAAAVSGLTASSTNLAAGRMMTIPLASGDNQLVVLTQDLVADGSGNATAHFLGCLRNASTSGATIEAASPYAVMALKGTTIGWTVDPGQVYGITLEAEEAY